MIFDVQTEDDLVELRLFNSDTLISKRRWEFSQEVWQTKSTHVNFSHGIILGPSILESLNILLFEG